MECIGSEVSGVADVDEERLREHEIVLGASLGDIMRFVLEMGVRE